LLSDFEKPLNIEISETDLIFVFHPDDDSEVDDFKNKLKNRNQLILVSNNDYKLR